MHSWLGDRAVAVHVLCREGSRHTRCTRESSACAPCTVPTWGTGIRGTHPPHAPCQPVLAVAVHVCAANLGSPRRVSRSPHTSPRRALDERICSRALAPTPYIVPKKSVAGPTCHAGTPTPQLPLSSQFLICNKKPTLLLASQFLICDKKLAKNAGCSFYKPVSKTRKCTVSDRLSLVCVQ